MAAANKTRVAVLCGGRSGEHEVSLLSSRSVVNGLDRSKYNVVVVGIGKDGEWSLLREDGFLINADDPKSVRLAEGTPILPPYRPGGWVPRPVSGDSGEALGEAIDVVLPILHGTFGEDGALQGLFELADVAYAGAGVLGSALAMDKDAAKRMLRGEGIPVVDWICFDRVDEPGADAIVDLLGLPLFVKPVNLGSSVGIAKAKDEASLAAAIADAFRYDERVIVEKAIDAREIEVSVLGGEPPTASVPGEIRPSHEFYSYDAKYIDENGADLIVPADLPAELSETIRRTAVEAFRALFCQGMARVDFFVERGTDRIFVNELNTIPGFTKISMYPKLWAASGIPFSELLDRLIDLALERRRRQDVLTRDYGA